MVSPTMLTQFEHLWMTYADSDNIHSAVVHHQCVVFYTNPCPLVTRSSGYANIHGVPQLKNPRFILKKQWSIQTSFV